MSLLSEGMEKQQEVLRILYTIAYWTQWIDCIFKIVFEIVEIELS